MNKFLGGIFTQNKKALRLAAALLAVSFLAVTSSQLANAQDQGYDQDDPPGRVARLGYIQGSVSFQPAGENEWVQAVSNRPMTTGDKLWADKDARAEIQLGSAMINLAPNTGFSFLNLDDRTVQMEVTAGAINIRVWSMDRDNVFEIDTPNQAFTIEQPGRYKIESSENGDFSVVTIWQGAGESTGNGQSYTLHAGQRTTFSGTNALNAEVQQIGNPDDFDNWAVSRERRYDNSPSARYVSREVVGYDDLDENGDWQAQSEYGNVWYPRVNAGWAPYRDGHWAWIDPWGWTWVDDARWGYAPFHYGRWAFISNRWGWIPGPIAVRPVYAPALVVFVGGGGIAFGGNVAWFPLGPREVYVPSYQVSRGYVNRVNVSNTVVNQTTITNVYNTTIINKNTTINNVTYVNRNVNNAVTAVPQRAFVSAQPVARAAVQINRQQIASAPMSSRAAVPPAREAVLGLHANTANRVAAPPQAVANRTITAKATPPAAPPSFAARQQALTQHPGESVGRPELQRLAPAASTAARAVRVAPPAKPATATPAPANAAPGNQPNRPGNPAAGNERPGMNPPGAQPNNRPQPNQPAPNQPAPNDRPANQPAPNRPEPNQPVPNNRPAPNAQPNQPATPPSRADRPAPAQPDNRPQPNPTTPNNRPDNNRPFTPPANRPEASQPVPNNRPAPNVQPNRPTEPAARPDRPMADQPNSRPEPNQPAPNNRPDSNRPDNNRPQPNRPEANQPAPSNRPAPNAEPNRQPEPPARAEHPSVAPPNARPSGQPIPNNRPDTNRPDNNRPEAARPSEQPRSAPTSRPETAPRPQSPPAETRPAPQQHQPEPQQKPEQQKDKDKDDKRKPQ